MKLKDILLEENIIDKNFVDNWQQAVDIAAEPLLRDESIELNYIEKMKENVNKYGNYMVLKDNFALMHARPEDGVNKTGFSLLKLKNSVDMEGKNVKIFLVLSAVDKEKHIEALSDLTKILSDKENFDIFLNGDKKDIINLIKSVD